MHPTPPPPFTLACICLAMSALITFSPAAGINISHSATNRLSLVGCAPGNPTIVSCSYYNNTLLRCTYINVLCITSL